MNPAVSPLYFQRGCRNGEIVMSAPVGDDDSSDHLLKYAPQKLREQPRTPAAPQSRSASPTSASHAQVHGNGGGEEIYEPVARFRPQLRRRRYTMLELISGIAMIPACTAVLIMVVPNIMKTYWQGSGVQRDAASDVPQASRQSDQLVTNKAPAGGVTGIAGTSGAQQPSSLTQPQLAAFARQFEQNPVQGITENEIRFGISAPFSGAAKELGQNMKIGIDARV